ncbi:MAG: cobalamin synthesis protein [Candidatus Solibacter sp.]|nr:cobalamin synthesis protein [Candidatus Solibacter sp.]
MKPVVAVVGGFLGAGKTTLILAAARILQQRGTRVAVVLNDQAGDLVDTRLVETHAVPADQVTGGCFCCRFPDLLDALARLDAHAPEVIFAEAVGSCTDIAATTLRPLLRDYPDRYRVAPLTAVVHARPQNDDLQFLYDHQVAEADVVFHRGDDPAAWLAQILGGASPATHSLKLDYTRYAEAEAALAWLNARVAVRANPPISPAMLVGPLLDRLATTVPDIVHLKLFTQCNSGYLKAALTANHQDPQVEGALDASPARDHEILLNIRALADPAELRAIVTREFAQLPAALSWHEVQSFRPSPPVPYLRLP